MYAPGQTDAIPFITPEILEGYDAFLFGIPTRYGNFPAQWKSFFDATGKQWQTGAYVRSSSHPTADARLQPLVGQICGPLYLDRLPRRRSGEHSSCRYEHTCTPWHDLRAFRLQDYLQYTCRSFRSPGR